MKVLVTGHLGYIGVEMVPVLKAAGHEVVGLDTGFYDECDFQSPPDPVASIDVDLRDVTARGSRGLRRRDPPRRALQRPARRPRTRSSPTTSTSHASVRLAEARARRRACRGSSSPRRAASTAPAATTCSTRTPPFNPVTPYGESKVRVEQERRRAGRRRLHPGLPAQRHRLRRRRRRLRADIVRQQPGGARGDDRQGAAAERRHAVASAGARARHLARLRACARRPARRRARPGVQRRPHRRRTYRIRDIANQVAEVVPAARWRSPRAPPPTRRDYRVDFSKIARRSRLPAGSGPCGEGIEQLYGAYKEGAPLERRMAGAPLLPSAHHPGPAKAPSARRRSAPHPRLRVTRGGPRGRPGGRLRSTVKSP